MTTRITVSMEAQTASGRRFGGSLPVTCRADLKAAIARLSTELEREAMKEFDRT